MSESRVLHLEQSKAPKGATPRAPKLLQVEHPQRTQAPKESVASEIPLRNKHYETEHPNKEAASETDAFPIPDLLKSNQMPRSSVKPKLEQLQELQDWAQRQKPS